MILSFLRSLNKIMKKTKIIIPALGMLLLSTAASVTGTVAWFAANASVSANGLVVTAKSENTYLLISKTSTTAADIQTENVKAVSLASESASILPSAPCLTSGEAAYLTTSGKTVDDAAITTAGVVIDNQAKAAAVTNWYTATAAAPSASTMEEGSARQLSSFTNYVIVEDLYLTVAAGANGANNLKVISTITQNTGGDDVAAIKYLIATDDGAFSAINNDDNGSEIDIKGSNTTLTSTTVRHVYIYAYYDGNAARVFTNNAANLKGASINLTFKVTATAAA